MEYQTCVEYSMIKDAKQVSINDAITLCYILDGFDKFNNNLLKFIKNKNIADYIYFLNHISHGKILIGKSKVKEFYEQNKVVIDEINIHNYISNFILNNYSLDDGMLKDNTCLNKLYNYLKKHEDEKEKAIDLLLEIRELGIKELYFDENMDFTDTIYEVDKKDPYDICLYVDNMEGVPNYFNNIVLYKTKKSNYGIKLQIDNSFSVGIIEPKIYLNSLLFDPSRLPKNLTAESTFHKIYNLKEKQKNGCIAIQNAIDLSIHIEELCEEYTSACEEIENLKNFEKADLLRQNLLKMKEYLNNLKTISEEYNNGILAENKLITKEHLKHEKTMCLNKKFIDSIHMD